METGSYKHPESSLQKMRDAWARRKAEGIPHPMKGKHFSEDARKNMGRKKGFTSEKKGIPRTLDTRRKVSHTLRARNVRGEEHPSYKHGESELHHYMRRSPAYKRWRFDVFLRDQFTCQQCGDSRGGNLRAHHIKSFAEYPELQLDIDNGITLCKTCHDRIHFKPDSIRNKARTKRQRRQEMEVSLWA